MVVACQSTFRYPFLLRGQVILTDTGTCLDGTSHAFNFTLLDANTSVMFADVSYPTPSLRLSHQFSTHLGANLQTLISSGSLMWCSVNNITVYDITKSYSATGGVAVFFLFQSFVVLI